jgi:hypothetical protein
MPSTHGQTPWEMLPAVQSQAPARRTSRHSERQAPDTAERADARSVRPGPFPDLDELLLSFDWPPPGYRSQPHL